jgi:predicted molibdopterin-dependent oxidoreductase YjgC
MDLAPRWRLALGRCARPGLPLPCCRRGAGAAIRALWIIATNPAVSFPNHDVIQQALETVDLLVVQDGFHPTPTSEYAHLVLPAAIWGEKEGTYTNSERRVSKVNRKQKCPPKAVNPAGN